MYIYQVEKDAEGLDDLNDVVDEDDFLTLPSLTNIPGPGTDSIADHSNTSHEDVLWWVTGMEIQILNNTTFDSSHTWSFWLRERNVM